MADYVTYLRVSTNQQRDSGLGIEAQRALVMSHIKQHEGELTAEFIDYESGAKTTQIERPNLHLALQLVAFTPGCKLLLAKTDRLARDLHFVSGLLKDNVPVIVAGHENMTKLEWHMHAMIAEHERDMISQRTKAALEQAKLRGVILGAPRDQVKWISAKGGAATHDKAKLYRSKVLPLIEQLMDDPIYLRRGNKNYPRFDKIALRMNELGIKSPRNKAMTKGTIYQLLRRNV
tara:strand:+ start:8 stop:706 length:699 start_codon:yes stop_codon:yes gene_type:complete